MNEQAIKDSYELFKTGGYSKSYEEFVELINSNPQALEDSYTLFKTGGYNKSMEEYEELMGVKKKDGTSESIVVEEGMESVSPPQPESGSSDVSAPQEAESDLEAYQNTPVTAPQEGVAVADPNLVALQEGESVYDANERVAVALAAEDDAKDQRSAFDRSLDIIDNRQHEQESKLGLNFRDKDYVVGGNIADLEEEEVVGEMDYHFKDYGFKFEETGATGDFMKVTAPNGVDTIEISLDNWTDAKDASESKKLKKFMQQNKPIEKTGLNRIESEALGNEKKILGKRDYEERMTSMQTATIDLKDRVKDFTQRKIASDRQGKEFSRMGQAELLRNKVAYDQWLVESANIKAEGGEIEGEIEGMKSRGKKLDRLVGSYVEMRSKEGSFGGGLVNSVWEGFGTMFSGAYGTGVDLITAALVPAVGAEEADKWSKSAKGLDKGGGEVNEFSQAASGFMSQERKGIQRLIRERGTAVSQGLGSGTSKEYTDSAGFVESSIYGVASSVPAMVSGIVGLVAQGIDMVSAETENNPLFEDVSELEKLAIAAPIGIVAGILEKVGLTKAIAGTSAISSVTHNLLKKFGVSATTRTFSEFVENEVERGGSRFLLKMASSGLSEAETGGLQEINDILMKKIYNEVKGQDLFQTPETFGDAVLQVIEASAAEAIGGFAMGTPGAVVSGALGGNLNSVSDETFAVFESVMNDGPMKEAYIESIKQKIVAGEMTKAEGQKAIQEAEDVAGVASQIPSDYTGDQKKKALGLLLRRAKLQTQVDKGDKQLVTKQQAEIDSINESLKEISEETTTPTITEATTEEAIKALEAEDAIREKMTGKPSATARTRAVIEKKRQELNKERQEQSLKQEQDAIQESSTTEVDVQEQATDGEAVGSGDPDGGTAEDGTQETTDVTGEDTSESEEVAILETLFGSETGKRKGEEKTQGTETKGEEKTQGTETKGEETIEVGEKTKIETPDGTELEVEKMEANVGIVSDPKVKTPRSKLQKAVVKIANTSAKALAKILPNTKIVLHSSPESYKKLGGRGKGMYKGSTIHINLSTATLGTISHEIFHAVLSEKLGTESRIQMATKEMLETVMNSITDKKILERLEKFRLLYEAASQQAGERAASLQSEYNQLAEAQDINSTPEGQAKLDSLLEQIEEATNEADGFIEVLNEEQLAEVTAILAEHYSEANSETKSAIVTWLKKISKTLGLSPTVLDRVFSNKGDAASKNQAVIDLLNTIARKTISGEEITDSDIETLEQYAKPVDKKVAPKARAEEAAPQKKVAPKPKETSVKEEFDIQDTTKRQELNEDGTKKTKAAAPVTPKSKVVSSSNLGDGYKYQGDQPAGKSLYRSGLENRHDKSGQYSPGKSLVITETKGKEAVTKKQGLLRKTVEVSPAVEGEIIVQARATTDSAGNVLPGSRGTSAIYSTVIVDPSTMDGMSEEQKDAYLAEVQQEVKADLKAKIDALGDTSGMKENDVTNKLNALEKGRTKNQLGGGEVVPGEAVEDAEGPIPTNIPDSDGPSIDLKTKTKFNLDRGGIDMGSIKRGSVNELSGTDAFVFAADQATYGTTKSPSGLEFKFDGGFLYPYGAQSQGSSAAWVFSTEGAANKIINKANNSDGVGLVMSQASDGITGNLQFYDYINAEVAYAIENGASPKEMINYINSKLKLTTVAKGLKKKGLPSQISSIEELQTLLSPLNFEQRGSFAKTFLSQESYKKFNISPFAPLKSVPTNISEVVNDPSLKGVGYGDVVSAIEFEKGGKPFKLKEGDPGYHPAYPWAIPGKPLMVFDKAVDVRKIYPNAKPASLESNQTPLGERTKPLAARSAMGGQYVAKVPKDIQVKGAKVKFQLDVDGADASIQEIITEGRGAGLKDSAIGSYLNRIKNVPKNVVKKLLEFDVDLFSKLPKSFAEVEGGLLEGIRLFKNIQDFIAKEINSNATRNKESAAQLKTKVREKRKELTKAKVKTADQMREIKRKIRERVEKTNKMRVNPRPKKQVDAKVKELYEIKRLENIAAKVAVDKAVGAFETKLEKSNAKKRAKLSDQEIMDLAIERLMEHPAYKKLANTRKVKGKDVAMKDAATIQAEMVNALQKTLGVRPTQNMRQALTKLRQMVRFRNQGARQLQEAKRELLRFMRQTLPKTAYSKQEALSLARRIAQATSKDMNGLMHEVIQLSTKKNVGILSRAISKILKPYESKQSGRLKGTSIDNTTRRVVKNLISNIKFPKTVLAKEIDDRNIQLLQEFNELANKMETTPEERQQMEGLIAAINLNNAMLMEDNDPNKAIALDRAYAAIKGLIDGGRSNLKETLAREKAEFDKSYKEIHKDITGEDLPLYEEDVLDDDGKVIHEKGDINFDAVDLDVSDANNIAIAKEAQGRLVNALRGFSDMVKNYFFKQNDLGGMINKISKLPGEIFGGITDQQVVDRIDEGTRVEKANNLMMKRSVEGKMKELWGRMWKFKVGALASVNKTGIYIDQAAVDKAQKTYDDNPTSENKVDLREVKRKKEISISQGEAYYLYNQFKDPSNHPSFEARFGKDYERIMGELTSTLDPETKAFADWQVDEFFPMVYPIFNEAYLKVYKTDMPWNEFYAGPLMHKNQVIQDLDLLAGKGSNTVVTANSSKYRVQTKDPIKQGVDGTANLMFYIEEMNHFAGMAEPINYINKLLLNPKMAATIEAIYGSDVLQGVKLSIQRVANKGKVNNGARFVNFMNSAFITSRLGINPVVMVKQLTSFFTYASDIGYANWVRYAAVNTVQMRKIFKEIKANSVYMDDRNYQSIMKAIETYAPERVQKFMPQPIQNALINMAMWTTKFGDKAAIYIGGMPNYSYHKAQFKKNNPGATEQQAIDYAIRRFEKDTKNTQQSSDIQNKDLYQTGDGYMRVLNMFMTTPKQYNRKVFRSLRNLSRIIRSGGKEGKGTLISNARTILTYHFVMPMFFQWVALGFPLGSDWDEEDEEDMMRAAIIGNFNSLFIAGDVIGMVADAIQGKPWAFNMPAIPALDMPKNVALYMNNAAKAKTPETKEKWTRKAINEGLAMFGIPASNIQKIFNNFTKLTEGGMEPKEAMLRVLQYSDYVIDGPEEKKKKKKKRKPTKKEMKEYFPEQYKEEQELEEYLEELYYDPEQEEYEAEEKAYQDELREEYLESIRE